MLFKLLGLPLTLPAAGVKWVFNTVLEQAEQEYYDDGPVKEALLLLNMQLEEGEISEEEFAEQEQVLFARLREIREHREEQLREMLAARAEEEGEGPEVIEIEGGHAVIDANLDEGSYGQRE
jgi:hypothetical protein